VWNRAVAAGLDLDSISPAGGLKHGQTWELATPVRLTQSDIRELQLAKGAIAAGVRILLARLGASTDDVARVYLAGAFGNYINRASARRIGLLNFPLDKIEPAGNTALLGAKMALFAPAAESELHSEVRRKTEHISLAADPAFQETYVEQMLFPAA